VGNNVVERNNQELRRWRGNMNKIIMSGNLCSDTKLETTKNGIEYIRFCLAVKRRGAENETDFINVIAWRILASKLAKYMTKGKKVAVVGQLTTRKYESQGQQKMVYEVVAEEIELLSYDDKTKSESPKTIEDLPKVNEELPF